MSSQTNAVQVARNPNRTYELTNILYPSLDGGWRDIYRAGWVPGMFNPQWGGAQLGYELVDGVTNALYKFEPATGQIEDNTVYGIGVSTTYTSGSTGFKVSESFNIGALWLKLYKVQGTVSANYTVTVSVYSDNGSGLPNTSLGVVGTISCKQLTSSGTGEWYRISGGNISLVAGTQYHIVITQTTVDASNYIVWKATNTRRYPYGSVCQYSGSAWSVNSTSMAQCFFVEAPASNKILQSGGVFDQKLVFTQGSLVDQGKSLRQPLVNFYDGTAFTSLVRGNSFTKGKTITDFQYGIDHDRIVLTTSASTGAGIVTIYNSSGTAVTLTGTTDLSTATNKDIAVVARTIGDGADYAQLWINGIKETEVTAQSFVLDPQMKYLGTAWLGGGLPIAPTWTVATYPTALLSTLGWTYTGTATEANVFSSQSNKLIQNSAGYGVTDYGYYNRTFTLSNSTGWVVETKMRTVSVNGSPYAVNPMINVSDGTKAMCLEIHDYFVSLYSTLTANGSNASDFIVQGDFKSQEHVFLITAKGSDIYVYIDGKLVIDGTGKLTLSSATNTVSLGDGDSSSGANGDAVWSYIKVYSGGMLTPDSCGGSINEYAYWVKNKSSQLPDLYNGGTPISIKQYCGMERNYVENVAQKDRRGYVAVAASTTSTTPVLMPEMELYVIGSQITVNSLAWVINSASLNGTVSQIYVDGVSDQSSIAYSDPPGSGNSTMLCPSLSKPFNLGLHKVDIRWRCVGGTMTRYASSLTVEAKS